ncbi:MAG: 6-phosphofructokinase, partial [Candidatus Izemoplasmataceae bacterium]
VAAIDLLMEGGTGSMVRCRGREISAVPLEEVVGTGVVGETSKGGAKYVDPNGQLVKAAKSIGISFGD